MLFNKKHEKMKTIFKTWLTLISLNMKFKINIAPAVGAALIGAGSGFLGIFGQNARAKKQYNRQRKLMLLQQEHQKELNQQGHDLSYEMWEKTNYPAQMGMLKEAGLNTALMYGQAGAGGTTSQASGGSAAGGQSHAPMDIGNALQAATMAAQIKLMESQAKKTDAEANKIEGVDTQEAQVRINKNNVETELLNIQKTVEDWKWKTDMTQREIAADVNKLEQTLDIIQRENLIDSRTMYDKIETIKNEAIYSAIKIEAETQNIQLSKQQEERLWHQIRQEWVKAGLQGLDTIIKGRLKDIGRKN